MATITNCNKLITLGALDTFINGLIQDSNGNTLSVNYKGKSANYCPTYAELTNGDYIQVASQNTSPTLDVDGIVIDGSYQANQCVLQGDLKAKYTRFDSLVISSTPSTVGACSATTTLGYTLKYNRYTKSYASNCTTTTTSSTSAQDTIANVVWSQSPIIGTISYPTFNISKNEGSGGGTASSRTTTLSAKVTFRGADKQSNTVGVTQSGLDGYWSTYSTSSEDEYSNFTLTNYIIPFTGGTATGQINKKTTTYANQRWVDDCGTIYTDKTQTVVESSSTTQEPWSEVVTQGNCNDTTWVSGDIYNRHYTPLFHNIQADREVSQTGVCCSCNDFSITSFPSTFSVNGGTQYANYTAGTCVTVTSATSSDASWLSPTIDVSNSRVQIGVSANTAAQRDGTVTVSWSGPNNCSSSTTLSITQNGTACNENSFSVSTNSLNFTSGDSASNIQTVTITSGYCHSNINVSLTSGTAYFNVTTNGNIISVAPESQNNTTSGRSGEITVSYYTNGVQSPSKKITLQQAARACNCNDFNITGNTAVTFSSAASSTTVGYTADTCVTSVNASSTVGWLTASTNNGQITLSVLENGVTSPRSTTVNVTYTGPNGCSPKTILVTQDARACQCSDLTPPSNVTFTSPVASSTTVSYTADSCIGTNVSVSNDSGGWLTTIINTSRKEVTLSVIENTSGAHSATVTLSVSSLNNCSKTFTVSQNGTACECETFDIDTTELTFAASASTASTAAEITIINSGYCHSVGAITIGGTDSSAFSASTIQGNKIYVVARNQNTSTSTQKTATLTIPYTANSTSCTSKTVTLTQSARDCDCSSDFSITGTVPTFSSSESGVTKYDGYTADTCITSVTASSNASWLTASADTNSKRIVVKCNSENTASSRTAIVTVSWGSSICSSSTTLSVTQDGPECVCNINVPQTTLTFAYNDNWSNPQSVNFTKGYCNFIGLANLSELEGLFNVTIVGGDSGTTSGYISIHPTSTNTGTSDITRVVRLNSFKGDGLQDWCGVNENVTIVQEGRPCNCNDFNISGETAVTFTYLSSRTSVGYTADTCVSGINATVPSSAQSWLTATEYDGRYIQLDTSQNESTSSRSANVSVNCTSPSGCSPKTILVTQGARPCDCSSDFSITGTVPTFSSSETGVTKYDGYTADTCVTSVTASSNANWLTASVDAQNKRIAFECNSENTASSRTAIVAVSWGSSICSSSTTLDVRQNGSTCDCDALTITPSSDITWDWDDGRYETITINSAYCHSNISITSSGDNTYFNINPLTGNSFEVCPVRDNSGATKTATLDIEYSDGTQTCHKYINIIHYGPQCNCSTLQIAQSALTSGLTFEYGSGPQLAQTIRFTKAYCNLAYIATTIPLGYTATTYYDGGDTASTSGYITIYPTSANTSTTTVEQELVIMPTVGDISDRDNICWYSPISVKLYKKGKPCDCNDLTIT